MRRRSGFTLTELAICLALISLLVPVVYTYALNIEDRFLVGQWHLESADSLRTVADAIQSDQQRGPLAREGLAFDIEGCPVRYALVGDAIQRDACGSVRTLARGISGMTAVSGGVLLSLERPLRVGRSQQQTLFIAVEER